jgi:tRNA threonylcarbamoyl adenosine modification protein YeaZ
MRPRDPPLQSRSRQSQCPRSGKGLPSQYTTLMILGADTSLPIMSVALMDGDRIIGAAALEGKESRNEKLLPAIDWLLRESGTSRTALTLLAVTRGPGSFTGVRIALATMQGLGIALGIPLLGFPTHEAAAYLSGGRSVLVHSAAGRGERYVAGFVEGIETIAPALMTTAELLQHASGFEQSVDLDQFASDHNIARGVALLAETRARIEGAGPAEIVTPIYVRLAEAEVRLGGSSK